MQRTANENAACLRRICKRSDQPKIERLVIVISALHHCLSSIDRMHVTSRMAAILVFQNNDSAAMLLSQTNPVVVQLFSYLNTLFCFNKSASLLDT